MVNAMTNRKPVRIDENDNIFSIDYSNAGAVKGNNKNAAEQHRGKRQNVQINDVCFLSLVDFFFNFV